MNAIGGKIRELRKGKKLPLRELADILTIDQAILSKIERGQRNITREQVFKLADYFKVSREDLIVLWLSDKIMYTIGDEDSALKALQMAEEKIAYRTFQKSDRTKIVQQINSIIRMFPGIQKTWIYGSFAREDDRPDSDIDLAVMAEDSFSYFDLAEIQHLLEREIKRKVDIGFIDAFKPHIRIQVEQDLKLVYEKPSR